MRAVARMCTFFISVRKVLLITKVVDFDRHVCKGLYMYTDIYSVYCLRLRACLVELWQLQFLTEPSEVGRNYA
uniref:Secreted protein n=1 Tax=Oryza brachyantha TaxID=4533 RepID=J3LS40_ORYBR